MAFPDTLKPVVLNASTSLVVSTDFYLRDVCIISLGDTKLSSGDVSQVDETSYASLFDSNVDSTNETYRKISSYYIFASSKPVYVFELGSLEVQALASTFSVLKEYATTLTGNEGQAFSDSNWLKWYYTNVFSNTDNRDEYASALAYAEANYADSFTSDAYTTWYGEQAEGTYATQELVEALNDYLASLGLSELNADNAEYLVYLQTNNSVFSDGLNEENLKSYLAQANLNYSDEGYQTYLIDNGSVTDAQINERFLVLKNGINEGNVKAYWYLIPNRFRDYTEFISYASGFSGTTDSTYFVIEVDITESPSDSSSAWQKYGGAKSIIGVWNNASLSSVSLSGAIAGRFASSIFDVSSSQKASPFNYKTLSGVSFSSISNTLRDTITQAALNFGGDLASNSVLLNGRTADGRGIDYWYQWDLTAYYIDYQLISLLLNGVNNPNYAIRYDQDGIDTIKANVESVLTRMVEYGCLTEYGTSLDTNTNEIQNPNHIYAIDYQTYITNNQENYNNEIYDGISFYARIGKYIRQITLSITLG